MLYDTFSAQWSIFSQTIQENMNHFIQFVRMIIYHNTVMRILIVFHKRFKPLAFGNTIIAKCEQNNSVRHI